MNTKETKVTKLHEKIAAVQQEAAKMMKNQEGYNYKFFDINQLLEELKPLWKKHGLLVTQPLEESSGKLALGLHIIDLDSDEMYHTKTILTESEKPQEAGSAITYYRRYALQSFFCLEAEDNDGQYGNTKEGLPAKEFNKILDSYLEGGKMTADQYESMSKTQQNIIQEIKKSRKRKK